MAWDELQEALLGRGLMQPQGMGHGVPPGAAVTGIAYDSRNVDPGQVFVALKGVHADGAAFVRQAAERGALAVVSEQPAPAGNDVAWSQVTDASWRSRFGGVVHRHPSRRDAGGQHHRHQRQDDNGLSRAGFSAAPSAA